jgi:hypothetical protein
MISNSDMTSSKIYILRVRFVRSRDTSYFVRDVEGFEDGAEDVDFIMIMLIRDPTWKVEKTCMWSPRGGEGPR